MPCWGALSGMQTFSGNYASELVKMTDKLDGICINGKFSVQVQGPSEWRVYFILVSNFTVFQPRIWTNFRNIGISSTQVVLKIWLGQECDSCQTAVKLEFERLFLAMRMLKDINIMLILGQNYISCAPNVVNFSMWFFQLTVWIFLNTWLLVMWLNRVRC